MDIMDIKIINILDNQQIKNKHITLIVVIINQILI